jgi:hypothetical protein
MFGGFGFHPVLMVQTQDCNHSLRAADDVDRYDIVSRHESYFLIGVISIIYFPILLLIYKWRHKQAVYFKSPKMIIVGGFSLYLDSIVNVAINSKIYSFLTDYKDKWTYICFSSVATTLVFHYIAYFCLIFRAFRIFKIMDLEKKFLDRIYKLA